MNIRKDDMVEVITGNDRGKVAKVLRVLPDADKLVVEGIAQVYRHTKPSRQNQQGGRVTKERAIAASNVQLYCASCRSGVRVGKRFTAGGQKERVCKKCGTSLGVIGRAKATNVGK